MFRFASLLIVLMAAGCSTAAPPDLRPFVAVAVRYSIQAASTPAPPSPSGKCKTCRGLGYVGDGKVRVTCGACGGTGVEPTPTAPAAAPNNCKDGTCPTPTTKR